MKSLPYPIKVLLLPLFIARGALVHWYYKHIKKRRSPCKSFNKKNSLECYRLLFDSKNCCFEHYPLFRVKNPKEGEYYLIPPEALQKKANRHLSYHKSGQFHWRESNGQMIIPADGEADRRRAQLIVQGTNHVFGRFDGYCLAVGKNVTVRSLDVMLNILDGYILPPLKYCIDAETLLEKKTQMIEIPDSPQRQKGHKLIDDAIKQDDFTKMSISDMEEAGVTLLEPIPTGFLSFSKDVTIKLINLGRSLAAEKLKEKPAAFWTK